MASDLDRADATISKLVSHLDNFRQACKTPEVNPSIHEMLQEGRIGRIDADLNKIQEDLNSVRARLQASAASSEEHAADQKKKLADLETATQAASKKEEQFFDAIKFADGQASEARKEKAQAKEEKAKAKEKKASAEEKEKAAESKRINAEKREEEVKRGEERVGKREVEAEKREEEAKKREERVGTREEEAKKREKEVGKWEEEAKKKGVEAKKREVEAKKREEEAKKREEEAVEAKADVQKREQAVSLREQDVSQRRKDVKARITALENAKKTFQERVSRLHQDFGGTIQTLTNQRGSLMEQCRLATDSIQNTSSIHAEVKEEMVKVNGKGVEIRKLATRMQAYGSELARNLKETKGLQSQVSADLRKFQQEVADNEAWVAANENAAKQTVASLKKALADVSDALSNDAEKLSSASTNVSRELADVTARIGGLQIATRAAKTLTTELVADFDSTGKRPLSSGGEPTRKRARSVGPVLPTASPLDKGPRANVSGGRLIIPLRSQLRTTVTPGPSGSTPGPSGSTPGPSGSSNEPSSSNEPLDIYGLRPGFGICPAGLRDTDNETQRTWVQIEFGAGWTMTDSRRLLAEFDKYAAKGVSRQTPQNTLDRCADATGNNANCLLQNIRKLGSYWNADEDKATKQCKDCTKKSQLCIRVQWAGGIHGAYNRDATNVKRWTVTRRQL